MRKIVVVKAVVGVVFCLAHGSCRSELRATRTAVIDAKGLSGLTRDERGALWSVAENENRLVTVTDSGATRSYTVIGVPGNVELESVTAMGDGLFALGSEEVRHPHPTDTVYISRVRDGKAVVVDQVVVDYALWGAQADANVGIEGVCSVDDRLVIASETTVRLQSNKRAAPLAIYDRTDGSFRRVLLVLSSQRGTVSGLDCWKSGDSVQGVAIERDFEVRRLLFFSIPEDSDAFIVSPTRAAPITGLSGQNPEGIHRVGPRTFELVVDNQYGDKSEPSILYRLVD